MLLSDISVKRPVLAVVMSLLLVSFGILSFSRLSLREYPNIDPPIVSISTSYRGASAAVVESRITQVIEDRIAGVEGIKFISSSSSDGRSNVSLEFNVGRDVNEAANDIRDRVSGLLDDLPPEAEPPDIRKVDSSDEVIMWLGIESDRMSSMDLTDYTKRYLQDRFSTIDGVARIRIGGGLEYSMRIWVDRKKLAARALTVTDIEDALRAQNVELPAGNIESESRIFTARVERGFKTSEDFKNLVIGRGQDGYLVKLSDVAKVELAPAEDRTMFRGNKLPAIGVGVIKQSTANTLEVAEKVREEVKRIEKNLPEGMAIQPSFDSSVFISSAVKEVYFTLFFAIVLVILVIYLFLGDLRAVLVPAVAVPVSLIASAIVLYFLDFSVNMFTLLALVLAIGMVVDDGIVVLENIFRRITKYKESSLIAAYKGAREVGFAVIATTAVLVSVFVPVAFIEGNIGRLFREFSITIAAAVIFSSFVALTLSVSLCSKLFTKTHMNEPSKITQKIDEKLELVKSYYRRTLSILLDSPKIFLSSLLLIVLLGLSLWKIIPNEFAPKEDRGAFFVMVQGPEGANYSYGSKQMLKVEDILWEYVENKEIQRLMIRAPRGWGGSADYSGGIAIVILNDWSKRRSAEVIINELRGKLGALPGIRAIPIMRQGLGGGGGKPIEFVIGGSDIEELAKWRDLVLEEARKNPGLVGLEDDYKETRPQLRIAIDRARAGDLGVSVRSIGRTLESMLGSRIVTTYIDAGEEYNVIVEGQRDAQSTPDDIGNIFVRSSTSGKLVALSNLVTVKEYAGASSLMRYNRMNAITISSNLADGYSMGEALGFLENIVKEKLPVGAVIDYKGASMEYKNSSGAMELTLGLALLVVFLVLAAQFESFSQPFVIMLTVPFAIVGALIGLFIFSQSLNIYSQIGLIILIGLATKNGILILEFINQLRDRGMELKEAIIEASSIRLRPIFMTVFTTAIGSLPLILASGAGSETRRVIGVVLFSGVIFATFVTVFMVPVLYQILCAKSQPPETIEKQIEYELAQEAVKTS